MVKPRKILFVLTDGGRARFVTYGAEAGSFSTIEDFSQARELARLRARLRPHPAPTGFENSSQRHSVGLEDHLRSAKDAFMAVVADRALEIAVREEQEELFLAAPSRLIGVLRDQIAGRTALAGVLGKDLTKAPDHTLAAWLGSALFIDQASSTS